MTIDELKHSSIAICQSSLSYVLNRFRHSLFIGAPAGVHPVGASMEYGFNPPDLAFFNFEQLRELPCPIDLLMVEKAKSEADRQG